MFRVGSPCQCSYHKKDTQEALSNLSVIAKLGVNCRVPSDMPLYSILNEFQKGSHMAAVPKVKNKKTKETPTISEADVETGLLDESFLETKSSVVEEEEGHSDVGEVIGIVTLEDVNDGGAPTRGDCG